MRTVFQPGFNYEQPMANAVWTINHNLKRPVVVDVFVNFQGTLQKIMPKNVVQVNDNQLRVEFSRPMTGKARVI